MRANCGREARSHGPIEPLLAIENVNSIPEKRAGKVSDTRSSAIKRVADHAAKSARRNNADPILGVAIVELGRRAWIQRCNEPHDDDACSLFRRHATAHHYGKPDIIANLPEHFAPSNWIYGARTQSRFSEHKQKIAVARKLDVQLEKSIASAPLIIFFLTLFTNHLYMNHIANFRIAKFE